MIKYLLALIITLPSISNSQDLKDYIPINKTNYYVDTNGNPSMSFSFIRDNKKMKKIFSFNKNKGTIGSWSKAYWNGHTYKHKVIQPLFFSDKDNSLIELGGIKSKGVTTYKSNGKSTGLYWSPPNGLEYSFKTNIMDIFVDNKSINLKAFSRVRLIEYLPKFTLERGNKKTYHNVIHMVMYHGTSKASNVTCYGRPIKNVGYVPYIHLNGYKSYAIELWLAPNEGIIKQRIPFTEDREGIKKCSGNIFNGGDSWTDYLMN